MKKFILFLSVIAIILIIVFRETIIYDYKKSVTDILNIVKSFHFSKEASLKEWEEKILKGKVVYKVENLEQEGYVTADSRKTASALYYKIPLEIGKNPFIAWKWKVSVFPDKRKKEDLNRKDEEDFAARIYVIFPAKFFLNSKAIEYIWAKDIPEGTKGESPYSKNIKVMVLRSGDGTGQWMDESRDIYGDYIELFGEKPKMNIGAISFMTDSDSTGTQAAAQYDDIRIGYKNKGV